MKDNYLKVAKAYAAYRKKLSQPSPLTVNPDSLEAMTPAVTKMAEAMQGSKPSASGLEKLPVPIWDGSRRSYSTWKKEFNHWMNKCSQDKDEQLQENQCQKTFGGQTKLRLASLLIVHGKSLILSSLINER